MCFNGDFLSYQYIWLWKYDTRLFDFLFKPGLWNGNECVCNDEPPDLTFEYIQDELEDITCNVTCSGAQDYACGGVNAFNFYIASTITKYIVETFLDIYIKIYCAICDTNILHFIFMKLVPEIKFALKIIVLMLHKTSQTLMMQPSQTS